MGKHLRLIGLEKGILHLPQRASGQFRAFKSETKKERVIWNLINVTLVLSQASIFVLLNSKWARKKVVLQRDKNANNSCRCCTTGNPGFCFHFLLIKVEIEPNVICQAQSHRLICLWRWWWNSLYDWGKLSEKVNLSTSEGLLIFLIIRHISSWQWVPNLKKWAFVYTVTGVKTDFFFGSHVLPFQATTLVMSGWKWCRVRGINR